MRDRQGEVAQGEISGWSSSIMQCPGQQSCHFGQNCPKFTPYGQMQNSKILSDKQRGDTQSKTAVEDETDA